MKKSLFVLGVLFPAFSYGASNDLQTSEVVVTANRLPDTASSVMAPISVVTEKEITQKNLHNVKEVLELLPGVSFVSYGGRGQAGNFYVRGGSAEHVLVLLDGNALNSTGIAALNPNFIPANMIERVEYLRGQRAAVYGANAISGVVNIITKPEYKNRQKMTYIYSGKNTHDFDFANTVSIGESSVIKLSGGSARSDGYNVHPVLGVNDGDEFGYKNRNLNIVASHTFDIGAELWASYNYLENKGEYDNSSNYFGPYREKDININKKNIISLGSNYLGDSYSYDLGLMYSNTDDYNRPKGATIYGYSSSVFKVKAFNGHFINYYNVIDSLKLGFSFDYDNNVLDSDSMSYGVAFNNGDVSLVNRGYGLHANYDDGFWLSELSLRLDDNSVYDTKFNFNAGLGVKVSDAFVASVRGGTAYRAPTLSELYYPDTGYGGGNPNLDPEKSKQIEVDFKGTIENFSYYVNGFYSKIEDMIAWNNGYNNINEARIRGIELGAQYRFADWLLVKGSADFTDPEDTETGKTIAYRSKQIYKVDVSGNYSIFDYFANWRFNSKRRVSDYQKDLPGYGLVDLGFGVNLFESHFRTGFKAENVFDRKFETSRGYPNKGAIYSVDFTLKNFF